MKKPTNDKVVNVYIMTEAIYEILMHIVEGRNLAMLFITVFCSEEGPGYCQIHDCESDGRTTIRPPTSFLRKMQTNDSN